MTVSVVVVSFVALFITAPVQGFADQSRRAKLVDAADSALSRMGRDVRRALPNSIRTTGTGGRVALELLGTIDGARYRAQPPGDAADLLDITSADDAFAVIGPFTRIAKPWSSTGHYLAVYNVGVPGADAYELANVITPAGTQIDITSAPTAGEDRVVLSPAFRFAYASPTQRVYLVDGSVTYLCDPSGGTLRRFSGYAIAQDQTTRDSAAELLAAGATEALMSDRITSCAMSYSPGTAERAGLVTLEIGLGEQDEMVSLLSQVHVDNVP
jgi:MSHA biogenesis protein MshO